MFESLKTDANLLFTRNIYVPKVVVQPPTGRFEAASPLTITADNPGKTVTVSTRGGKKPVKMPVIVEAKHMETEESKGWSLILLLCLGIGSVTFLTALKVCDVQTYKELMIATISGVLGVIVGRKSGR